LTSDEEAALSKVAAKTGGAAEGSPGPAPTTPPQARSAPPAWVPALIGTVGLAATVAAAVLSTTKVAIATGGASFLAVGFWVVFSDPPPPSGDDKNPAGLNFGR
jgi:hypothetical protein